ATVRAQTHVDDASAAKARMSLHNMAPNVLPVTGSSAKYRLGVDVGGTHTDLVLLDPATGVLLVEKVSSTPENPALGVLNGVARFVARGLAPGESEFFAHGT